MTVVVTQEEITSETRPLSLKGRWTTLTGCEGSYLGLYRSG